MKLLTNKQQNSYENTIFFNIRTGKFVAKYAKDKKYCKVKDHCHYTSEYKGAARKICNLKCSVPKEIPIVFYNGSYYDYHFIMKELEEEFEGQFTCLGKNTEKYITSSTPIEKK